MTIQGDLFAGEEDALHLMRLLDWADEILVKKLSNNDRDWARLANKKQDGVYIPHDYRESGFFPPLGIKDRGKADAAAIREVFFETEWPQVSETKLLRLVHYTSKGQETHLTVPPKEAFQDLAPASFLLIGKKGGEFRCLTIDSTSDDAVTLIDTLEIGPDFLIGNFEPAVFRRKALEKILDFAEQVIAAWNDGRINLFATEQAGMPMTVDLARKAREEFFRRSKLTVLDPWKMANPGDALREISRGIEWDLFREYQRKERAVALVRLVLGDKPVPLNASIVIRGLVDRLPEIDAIMLSASQQRKSRAGYSFEHHIEQMLYDGSIPYEKQVIIEAKKRPDFILPFHAHLKGKVIPAGLILSAKTTLRERWKQVEREMHGGELFLATVDESIAGNAIEEMSEMGINLVVPEALKSKESKTTEYFGHKNVLSFIDFFRGTVAERMKGWPAKPAATPKGKTE